VYTDDGAEGEGDTDGDVEEEECRGEAERE
jgi:hypothetical protein